ncbi:MAG: AtpZ/AtpI family protein [Candidatus Adiutrix sp.]
MLLKRLLKHVGPSYFNALTQASTIGLHLVSGIAVGGIMGYFLDLWLETAPWGILIMGFLGIVAGFKNVYTDTKRLVESQKDEQKNDQQSNTKN